MSLANTTSRRKRRTKVEIEAIREVAFEELTKGHPMSLRQVHYRIVARGDTTYTNTRTDYNQLSRWLVMGLPVKDVHRKIKGFANDYTYIVLDTPPGEIAITRSALLAADTALLPVPPTAIHLDRVLPTLELVAEVEPLNDLSFRVLLTRLRRITREARDARAVMEEMGLPVMATEIPHSRSTRMRLVSHYRTIWGNMRRWQQTPRSMAQLPYSISHGSLAPGGILEGNLVVQVPQGDSGLSLIYEPFERRLGTITVTL